MAGFFMPPVDFFPDGGVEKDGAVGLFFGRDFLEKTMHSHASVQWRGGFAGAAHGLQAQCAFGCAAFGLAKDRVCLLIEGVTLKSTRSVVVQSLLSAAALVLVAGGGSAAAQSTMTPSSPAAAVPAAAPAHPTLQLDAHATRQVPEDTAWAVLSVERDAPDQATAQKQTQAAFAALMAKIKQAGPELEVRTETMHTTPVYAPKGGKITAWRSHMALRLQATTQTALVAQTAAALLDQARLQGTGFFLSPAKRQAVERELIEEAVKAFDFKAQAAARAMGFASTAYKDVALQQGHNTVTVYGKMDMGVRAAAMQAEGAPVEPLVMEPGQAEVSVSVSGTVHLLR